MAKRRLQGIIGDRATLLRTAHACLGLDTLVEKLGARAEEIEAWALGACEPDDDTTGAVVALLRMRFVCEVEPELLACASARRKRYLVRYMRDRAASDPAFAAKHARLARESKDRHREETNARERRRYQALTADRKLERLDRKREVWKLRPPAAREADRELAAARHAALMAKLSDNPALLREHLRRKRLAQRRWKSRVALDQMLGTSARLEELIDD